MRCCEYYSYVLLLPGPWATITEFTFFGGGGADPLKIRMERTNESIHPYCVSIFDNNRLNGQQCVIPPSQSAKASNSIYDNLSGEQRK